VYRVTRTPDVYNGPSSTPTTILDWAAKTTFNGRSEGDDDWGGRMGWGGGGRVLVGKR
jgi:hypothetical protein